MQVKAIIEKKREGGELSLAEMQFLIDGIVDASIPEYQLSAFLMAVFFRGMTSEERASWTRLMWRSGVTLPRTHRNDFWIDKHSTGGVGDKTSLILVPLVSQVCEEMLGKGSVRIPMISGRGLGHSGGTLDKLESVTGFSPRIDFRKAIELLNENSFFMMGQTKDLAPADRILYALRDATATVESLPLIVSSILSKKLSENLDGLVLDVKFGPGAFMKNESAALELAKALVATAKSQGVETVACLTNMSEPLGTAIGNYVEVAECADFIRGEKVDAGLHKVTMELAGQMVSLASRKTITVDDAKLLCEKTVHSNGTWKKFQLMFEAQGGEWHAFESQAAALKSNMEIVELKAQKSGYLSAVDSRGFGELLTELGGGRSSKESIIDPLVGFVFEKKVGDRIEGSGVIARAFVRKGQEPISEKMDQLVTLSDERVEPTVWLGKRVL